MMVGGSSRFSSGEKSVARVLARFDRCLANATSVSYATEDCYLGDDALFAYASRLAMGLAMLRAT